MLPITAPPGTYSALDQIQDLALNAFASAEAVADAPARVRDEYVNAIGGVVAHRMAGEWADEPGNALPLDDPQGGPAWEWQGGRVVLFAGHFLEPYALLRASAEERLGKTWSWWLRRLADEFPSASVHDLNPLLTRWLEETDEQLAQLAELLDDEQRAALAGASASADAQTKLRAVELVELLRRDSSGRVRDEIPPVLERLLGEVLRASVSGDWYLYDHGGNVLQESLRHPVLVRELGNVALTMQPWLVLRDEGPVMDQYLEWVSAKPVRQDGDGW
ncbi:hypothetical protein ACUH96_05490 [Dermabacteraceae bacterium P13077]